MNQVSKSNKQHKYHWKNLNFFTFLPGWTVGTTVCGTPVLLEEEEEEEEEEEGKPATNLLPGFSLAEGFKEATVYQQLKVQCETNLITKLKYIQKLCNLSVIIQTLTIIHN